MKLNRKSIFVICACFLSGAAFAQTGNAEFDQLDKNGDGSISTKEAAGSSIVTIFKQLDVDKDGQISLEEFMNK